MTDYIVRATAADGQIRAFAAYTKDVVEEARRRHNTSPTATVALGQLLTAGTMMGAMMKNDTDILTLQIRCDGPLGGLTVTADNQGNVKGYAVHPDVDVPVKNGQINVADALDLGVLNVIKDMGLKEPYVGQTILETSEIAKDLTYYYMNSESITRNLNKDRTKIVEEYLQTVRKINMTVQCQGDTKELLNYCLVSGLTANLIYNSMGCGKKRMNILYSKYDALIKEIDKNICKNKYIALKFLKSEPWKKRYATWLILRLRKIKLDRAVFFLISII